MPLLDAVAEAIAYYDSPPQTEGATCHWLIYPLLQAMGYAHQDILPQSGDATGQFPDYAVLPNNPDCWYVEAKIWSIALKDSHAHQAIGYAVGNGKRWVVLTNGRNWRLYDNYVHGLAADKLVTEVELKEPTALDLFEALCKEAYLSGKLEEYARRARVARALQTWLGNKDSAVIAALWKVVKKEPGLAALTREELVDCAAGRR